MRAAYFCLPTSTKEGLLVSQLPWKRKWMLQGSEFPFLTEPYIWPESIGWCTLKNRKTHSQCIPVNWVLSTKDCNSSNASHNIEKFSSGVQEVISSVFIKTCTNIVASVKTCCACNCFCSIWQGLTSEEGKHPRRSSSHLQHLHPWKRQNHHMFLMQFASFDFLRQSKEVDSAEPVTIATAFSTDIQT